ncbi:hypothetical protein O181_128580 [Austropuccinia psidii MF-1]|uniref:Uncharacterized protein n=1 Tax=Austropuccinia psidii MF-1 TaxID=1389203 RepID=A0A9Q3L0F7_9BASI|nr:hypothetical protein [Austropuccinia psidii MF-1]
MLPQIHQGVMNSCDILKRFFKEEEIVRYSNGWNPLPSKPQLKKTQDLHNKKREERKEEAQVASTSNLPANQLPQEGNKNKKKNLRKKCYPSYKISRIQNYAMENVLNMAIALMKVKEKEVQRTRQIHLQKK